MIKDPFSQDLSLPRKILEREMRTPEKTRWPSKTDLSYFSFSLIKDKSNTKAKLPKVRDCLGLMRLD